MWTRLTRTFEIWKKFGMSLQGVSSCGDYMFSGHTAIITIFNFFITECKLPKQYILSIICYLVCGI